MGAHGFASEVDSVEGAGNAFSRTRLRMLGGYLGYDADDWETIGEFYRFANSDVASGSKRSSNSWFLQVGKTMGAWTPFVRLENATLDANDTYFASQASGRSYKRAAAGVRYAQDARASWKFEVSDTREDAMTQLDGDGLALPFAGARYKRAALQYSVAF